MRLKASNFRSFVTVLTKQGRRDAVLSLVPPETAALITNPPLPGSWMDLRHSMHLMEAVEKLGGMAAVREVARQGTDDARKPYMSLVEGVLRMFGTSPATLLKRMNMLIGSFIEGVDFHYSPTDERSGVMVVEYHTDYEISQCFFVGQIPVLQTLLEVCGARGLVSEPERLTPRAARYHIRW